ncbi:MAG: DUF5067 domain-containing protein [Candidatus Weimeria sp.]
MANDFFNRTDGNDLQGNYYSQPDVGPQKTCKYCGKQIPASAKICPYCRKRQKGRALPVVIVIIVILVIIIAAAAGSDNSPKKISSSGSTSDSDSGSKSTSKEDDDTFGIGDTADFDGVQVTLEKALLSKGSEKDFVTPDDGKYFLELVFDINNNSSDDISVSSVISFEAYCDDTSIDQDIIGLQAPEVKKYGQLDGKVAKGKKMNGVICYQVPKDFKNFEIRYTPDFWGDREVIFKVPAKKVDSSAVK